MILIPPPLRPGDTIAVIAPAGPVRPSEVRPGLDRLESLGFRVLAGNHLYDTRRYLAGEDRGRLNDLMRAFRRKRVKAILCARGGYGTLRLLRLIGFDVIRENPKILVGYSDITALLLAVSEKTGLVTFHGPMVRDLLKKGGENLDVLVELLSGRRQARLDLHGARVLRAGMAKGRLVGGNLSLVCHLAGTPFLPMWRKCILFLEERGEALYRVDRMLTHLRLSGLLKRITGLVAGDFEDCGEPSDIDELLLEAVSGLDIPVVTGLPFGHGEQNMTLPVGLPAILDTASMRLSVPGPCVGV